MANKFIEFIKRNWIGGVIGGVVGFYLTPNIVVKYFVHCLDNRPCMPNPYSYLVYGIPVGIFIGMFIQSLIFKKKRR